MKSTKEKLNLMREALKSRNARVMIVGLGSVGNYLLNYLLSSADEGLDICVVGRNEQKLQTDINIARISSMIRGQNRSRVSMICPVDLTDISSITNGIQEFQPDILVNSSRAYPGLKYGSISWERIRAYGLWSPLAVRFTKNIMEACEQAGSDAIVINTSYSDAVIPWLKTAGKAYPDFGSGNINHLIPRIKFAAAEEFHIQDPWNIDVTFAVSHFHDVVISKEGQSEKVDMLLDLQYQGRRLDADISRLLSRCCIPMPADAKRNQMNASSNFEIIEAVLSAVREGTKRKLHCPGAFGEIGGYPVILDGRAEEVNAYICEEVFPLAEMRAKNRESIYLDGIEQVAGGVLTYTDELLGKVKEAFGVDFVKKVALDESDEIASFIIREIIEPNR